MNDNTVEQILKILGIDIDTLSTLDEIEKIGQIVTDTYNRGYQHSEQQVQKDRELLKEFKKYKDVRLNLERGSKIIVIESKGIIPITSQTKTSIRGEFI